MGGARTLRQEALTRYSSTARFTPPQCYPSDYGMKTCAVHDNTTDPACTSVADGEDRPAYCDEPWCYVDSSKCKDSIHLAYRTDLMLTKGGTPPTYSYSACGGDASQWRDPLVRDGLKGKTLKAGIADCFFPDHYMVDPVTNERLDDGPLLDDPSKYVMQGLWIEYFEKVALYVQFEVEYYPVTTASSTKFSSLWTACANDVALGESRTINRIFSTGLYDTIQPLNGPCCSRRLPRFMHW